jgi:hypothetical protein
LIFSDQLVNVRGTADRRRDFRSAAKSRPLFELARVLVPFDHVASVIVNANHGIM